ncbi:MAG: Uma2 family endonuclease, partial [Deltaproteobacteria bacterium]|nr:Uma2 family endonuclease [Deltaproteobacteria bacterium]
MATATLQESATKPHANGRPEKLRTNDPSLAFNMPAGSMTLDEFRQWTYAADFPRNAAIAFIAGEIFIDMSPERIDSHASVKVEIYIVLGSLVRKKRKGRIFFEDVSLLADLFLYSRNIFACRKSIVNFAQAG